MTANAPHQANAVKFLEYFASRNAQTKFAKGNNGYPAVKDVPFDNPFMEKYKEFTEDPINAAVFGQKNADALKK